MKIAIIGIAALLTGCASVSPIATLEPGVYTLSVQNVSSFGSRSQVIDKATEEASDFCGKQGKSAHLVNAMDNGTPGFATLQSTIVFRCVQRT